MTAPEEIVSGVYGIAVGPIVNAFVIVDEGVTLVDTGTAKGVGKIEGALRDLGRTRIDTIALTHHHPDHRGGAAVLANGANVYVHALDAPVVRGDRKQPGPSVGGVQKVLITALGPLTGMLIGQPQPAAVHKEISDGDEVPGGLRAVHTPGHTAGHVSFLHEGKRLLFVGDAAQHRTGLALPPPFFTEDMAQAKTTLQKIAALDFDVAVFGHGRVLKDKANAEFRKFVDRLAS